MCAKKEEKVEVEENSEIIQLKADIEVLRKENDELRNVISGNENLIVQIAELFQKADGCITIIKSNLIDGDERPVLAGAKIMELYGLIDNNNRILKEIAQRIQNREKQ